MTEGGGKADVLEEARETLEHYAHRQTDGKWLESLTEKVARHLTDWDVDDVHPWAEWPSRNQHYPTSTAQDLGIDLVARRRSDGRHIAIQCKARRLEQDGTGEEISKHEINKFGHIGGNDIFAELWLVTNGASPPSRTARQVIEFSGKPMKVVNLGADVSAEAEVASAEAASCPHCRDPEAARTRDCMQQEAVARSVDILRAHAETDSGGLPRGQARGRIVLPCGTGKTRIALRIVEELTAEGQLSVVLCPSIALVAQLRREFLQHAHGDIRAMAVCSDKTAGYNPKKEGATQRALDPTLDNSNVSAQEVKGLVTTDPKEIADWIGGGGGGNVRDNRISVIFGTYQSASRVAEASKSPAPRFRCSSVTRPTEPPPCAAVPTRMNRPASRSSPSATISGPFPPATASTRRPHPASTTTPNPPTVWIPPNSWFVRWTTRPFSGSSSTARATWRR